MEEVESVEEVEEEGGWVCVVGSRSLRSNVMMNTAWEREEASLAAVDAVARCSAPRRSRPST